MTNNYSSDKKSSLLDGDNAYYLESLYEEYLKNPQALSAEWQHYFANEFQPSSQEPIHSEVRQQFAAMARQPHSVINASTDSTASLTQAKVYDLINAYRRYGHRCAKIDPLGMQKIPELPYLKLNHYGLSETDQNTYDTNDLLKTPATIKQIFQTLNQIYCNAIGFQYDHIDNPDEVKWLQNRIENYANWQASSQEKVEILTALTQAEGLEKYIGGKFVGEKRFSIEGGETLIPILQNIVANSANQGLKEIMIGMAHRGRLNVLVNVLGKPAKDLFAQFAGTYAYDPKRSDDVKYHYGFSSDIETKAGPVHLSLGFNPSHLEIVAPVVQGSVRARQDRRKDDDHKQVLAIQIHGDSAFAGQGVVLETFQLSQTRGFKVGGSIHITVNNQVGFTTSNPEDTRSTLYCTDPAKMVDAPIFHVNGDQPEAAFFVTQLAAEYRNQFRKDVVIDLVCYRRLGHNESDEPSATQPLMYQVIRKLPTTRTLYAKHLVDSKILSEAQADQLFEDYRSLLDNDKPVVKLAANPEYQKLVPDWNTYIDKPWEQETKTALTSKEFKALTPKITATPENYKLQPQVARAIQTRATAYKGESPLIWGDAELLAYASLLVEGHNVRLVGQDAGRGTFAHRHAVLFDQTTGENFVTLNHLSKDQARFTIIDSLLSEEAVMAFEYGYACTAPNDLVLWEAQFGDFANGAQVVIDQFISSGEQKWNRYCGLVLLLPHGYEGMGPEHSSARLERFLQLCAQENIQVCTPTTPAQMFHLLRRQVLRNYRKPLVIMSPKSLLRKATSTIDDILNGQFEAVLPEVDKLKNDAVKSVIVCGGKVYYDLYDKRQADKRTDIAIIRMEQLYPFPAEALKAELAKYKKAKDIVWCQEEPQNQGAWHFIRDYLSECLAKDQQLHYAGRKASAAPAAGYRKLHDRELAEFLKEAFD